MMYNTYYCKSDLEHIQKTDQVHGQYAIDLGQITCPIANRPWSEDSPGPGPGPYVQTILGPKKWVDLSKIPTISSNHYTIMLLLIVGGFGYSEVHSIRTSKPISIQIETSQSEEVTSSLF